MDDRLRSAHHSVNRLLYTLDMVVEDRAYKEHVKGRDGGV